MSRLFRLLPSVDHCLKTVETDEALAALPRPFVRDLVNAFLDVVREEIRTDAVSERDLTPEKLAARMLAHVRVAARPRLRRVVNATGVVVHTNLGRSILSDEAARAVDEACRHYSNLEFDLSTGERGSRYALVEDILKRLTGAESALVVNNNAAAVLLTLDTLAKGGEVVVSRGQLVEIGGSFRIPDVMSRSGARLHEVGATNRTHLRDYEQAIGEDTRAIMRVHTSNYRIVGFTSEVSAAELKPLCVEHGLPLIEDLGSGVLYNFSGTGLMHEPTVASIVAEGADIVTFSGDKVLGGPQAGIIVGTAKYVDRMKKNPMTRALRVDKMTLAALEATLRLYLDPELARERIPTLSMITTSEAALRSRARRLAERLTRELGDAAEVSMRRDVSRVGGGAFPEQDLPTTLVRVAPRHISARTLKERLLATDPPLVGRLEDDGFCLDPRTLESTEYSLAARVLAEALREKD